MSGRVVAEGERTILRGRVASDEFLAVIFVLSAGLAAVGARTSGTVGIALLVLGVANRLLLRWTAAGFDVHADVLERYLRDALLPAEAPAWGDDADGPLSTR